ALGVSLMTTLQELLPPDFLLADSRIDSVTILA
nr:hypothetical protein [Tanacetum cinerariifolium]